MRIEKKILKEYFDKIESGKKKFELRLGDWECNEGDVLVLREWDSVKNDYTGKEIEKKVTYVFNTKEVDFWSEEEVKKHGYMIINFE